MQVLAVNGTNGKIGRNYNQISLKNCMNIDITCSLVNFKFSVKPNSYNKAFIAMMENIIYGFCRIYLQGVNEGLGE